MLSSEQMSKVAASQTEGPMGRGSEGSRVRGAQGRADREAEGTVVEAEGPFDQPL